MKKILFLIGLFLSLQSYGQDGAFFQSWYLLSHENDSGNTYSVSEISPSINPELIINGDLTFEGYAACNYYMGNFSYDSVNDLVTIENFDVTINLCDFQSHDDFELDYFGFLALDNTYDYSIIWDNDGTEYLDLELSPGNILHYRNYPLGILDRNLVQYKIFPNPVSNELFIASEGTVIEKIVVYSMSGQTVLTSENFTGSIDVSDLSEGLYFIEVSSLAGKSVQKFIKQ